MAEPAPTVDGCHHVGWLCQWGPRAGPNRDHHWGSWESNKITRERGDSGECPDCRPVYVPSP